jgi:hypothetical protein
MGADDGKRMYRHCVGPLRVGASAGNLRELLPERRAANRAA